MNDGYKKLARSRVNRMFLGVCGGIGSYFNLDPTLIRILWVIYMISSLGTGVLAYVIIALIIPEEE